MNVTSGTESPDTDNDSLVREDADNAPPKRPVAIRTSQTGGQGLEGSCRAAGETQAFHRSRKLHYGAGIVDNVSTVQ